MLWLIIPGAIFYGLGVLITVLNIDLGFLRERRHKRRGVSDEDYRNVSGIPLFGSVFLYIAAGLLYWDYPLFARAAIFTSLFDPWGIPWAIVISIWELLIQPRFIGEKPDDVEKK